MFIQLPFKKSDLPIYGKQDEVKNSTEKLSLCRCVRDKPVRDVCCGRRDSSHARPHAAVPYLRTSRQRCAATPALQETPSEA